MVPEWDEYEDSLTGRKFYYNKVTKEKSWKPPRKPKSGENSFASCSSSQAPKSPSSEDDDPFEDNNEERDEDDDSNAKPEEESVKEDAVDSPPKAKQVDGYELRTDADSGMSYYVNVFTGVRWYSAVDSAGKTYYYEENGNESCWSLPNVSASIQDVSSSEDASSAKSASVAAAEVASGRRAIKKPLTGSTKRIAVAAAEPPEAPREDKSIPEEASSASSSRRASMTKTEMLEKKFAPQLLPVSTPNFQIGSVSIVVVKQGPLHKTKLVENGKRTRKNWSSCHAVLTDTFLLFFKDQKAFATMQQHQQQQNKPDLCIDLSGARVEWSTGEKSKRNNVFEVSTLLGLTVLVQDDSLQVAAEWFQEIREMIEDRATRHYRAQQPPPRRLSGGTLPRTTSDSDKERKISEASQVRKALSPKLIIVMMITFYLDVDDG